MAVLRGEGTFHGIAHWLDLLRYAGPRTHPSVLTVPAQSIFRDCSDSVHSIYERVAQPLQSRQESHQMGTRRSHHGYVRVFDNPLRYWPILFIVYLHRQPRISWQ